MTDADADDLTARAASYAVDALTESERREFQQQLRRSPHRAAEVDEFAETAALLGLATAPVAPSPSLRAGIMQAVATTPQLSNVTRGPWFRRPVAAVLGAAAALLLIAGAATVALQPGREPSVVEQIASADDHERVIGEVTGGGRVTVVWSESLGRAVILVDGLAELPADRVYQAWLIDEAGHAAPNAVFGASGSQTLAVALTGRLDAGDAIGITIEPAGGSDIPTTTPIVVIPTT